LLDEGGRTLEGGLRLGREGDSRRPDAEQEDGQGKDSVPASPPPRRLEGLRGEDILFF
jgi:hypothetical protein